MKALKSSLLKVLLACGLSLTAHAQTIELQAITDFTNLNSGDAPYYLDIAGGRNVLAINAANPSYRDKFARAEHEFKGSDGVYDITINALGEIDGDGTYRLSVNGVIQGVSVNHPVAIDYTVIEHTFQGIALTTLDTIAVESSAVSNNTIPEGDGYAFARGRWRSVSLSTSTADQVVADTSADLGLSLSTVDSLPKQDGNAPFIMTVINNSQTNTATAPIVAMSLPDEMSFESSEACVQTQTGVRCLLPNLAPQEVASVSFVSNINTSGWISLTAAVSADQADNERANNTASLSFESRVADAVVTAPVTSVTPEPAGQPSNNGANSSSPNTGSNEQNAGNSVSLEESDNGSSGATGTVGLLALLLFAAYRAERRS